MGNIVAMEVRVPVGRVVQLTLEQLRDVRVACGLAATHARLEIWARWLSGLPGAAPGATRGKVRSLEGLYRNPRRARTAAQLLQAREVDRREGEIGTRIERIVRNLPDKHRRAVRAAWVRKGSLSARLAFVGVARSRYYELLHSGELMVRNHLHADALFRAEVDAAIEARLADISSEVVLARVREPQPHDSTHGLLRVSSNGM